MVENYAKVSKIFILLKKEAMTSFSILTEKKALNKFDVLAKFQYLMLFRSKVIAKTIFSNPFARGSIFDPKIPKN